MAGRLACVELAAGAARLSRGSDAGRSIVHLAGHDAVRVLDNGKRPVALRHRLCGTQPERQPLRFSRRGDPALEERYRTHWISPDLPESVQARLAKKASRPPELVVVMPLNKEWKCHRCGQRGDLLIMEKPGPACLRCVGLDDLEYLSSGDALLTRRAKAKSVRAAVVVRFSRSRRRYERQGLLVEPQALAAAQREISAQRPR